VLRVTADMVNEDAIPPYAILSYIWREEAGEVTIEDLATNAEKDGYFTEQNKM
jgi:hypothetical protein